MQHIKLNDSGGWVGMTHDSSHIFWVNSILLTYLSSWLSLDTAKYSSTVQYQGGIVFATAMLDEVPIYSLVSKAFWQLT